MRVSSPAQSKVAVGRSSDHAMSILRGFDPPSKRIGRDASAEAKTRRARSARVPPKIVTVDVTWRIDAEPDLIADDDVDRDAAETGLDAVPGLVGEDRRCRVGKARADAHVDLELVDAQ